jgi:hypothetical protein
VRYQDCALLTALATVLSVNQVIPTEAPRGVVVPTKKAWKHRKTNMFQDKYTCWMLRTSAAEGIFFIGIVCLPGAAHVGCPV